MSRGGWYRRSAIECSKGHLWNSALTPHHHSLRPLGCTGGMVARSPGCTVARWVRRGGVEEGVGAGGGANDFIVPYLRSSYILATGQPGNLTTGQPIITQACPHWK